MNGRNKEIFREWLWALQVTVVPGLIGIALGCVLIFAVFYFGHLGIFK